MAAPARISSASRLPASTAPAAPAAAPIAPPFQVRSRFVTYGSRSRRGAPLDAQPTNSTSIRREAIQAAPLRWFLISSMAHSFQPRGSLEPRFHGFYLQGSCHGVNPNGGKQLNSKIG